MDLIDIVVKLAVIGFVLYLIIAYVPMPAPFKTVIIAIIAIGLALFVLHSAGIGSGSNIRI